jgi:multidrug efflux pump subunit AcrA (membrane-fusion protein)
MDINIEEERQKLKDRLSDNFREQKKLDSQKEIITKIEQNPLGVELDSSISKNFSVDESKSIKNMSTLQIQTIRRDIDMRQAKVIAEKASLGADMRKLKQRQEEEAKEAEQRQRQAEEAEQRQRQAEKELFEMLRSDEKELLKSHAEEENEKKRRTKQSIQDRERAKAKKETDVLISAVVSAAAETNLIEAKEKTIHEMIGVSTKQKVLFDKMQTLRTCFDKCISGIFIRPYNMGMDDDTFEKILAEEVIGHMIASVDNATRSYRSARSRPRRASIAGGSLKKKRRRTKRKRKSKTYHKR